VSDEQYVFHRAATDSEWHRLRALEAAFDPGTQRHLLSTGQWTGRHCLEVGAGAGSIAAWMRAQVGPSGRVVAVDTNVRFLEPLRGTVDVVQGDIRQMDLGSEAFDLVHLRYVLVHNEDARGVLEPLVTSLKPGGWLLVEEPDFSAAHAFVGPDDLTRAFERVSDAIQAMFVARRLNPALGRQVPALLQQGGLDVVAVESDGPAERGGSPLARVMSLSAAELSDQYVATGRASPQDVRGYAAFAGNPSCWGIYYSTVRALGRKRTG
jgi:SAM-dependent methyltransferase